MTTAEREHESAWATVVGALFYAMGLWRRRCRMDELGIGEEDLWQDPRDYDPTQW